MWFTWKEVIPSILRCAYKIAFEMMPVMMSTGLRPKIEIVGLWKFGVIDTAYTFSERLEYAHRQ